MRDEDDPLKYRAEAAVFAAGILGRLNYCSASAATTVYENTKIGGTTCDFAAVKSALEANYACMNITCADVGGYVDSDGAYRAGFSADCTAAAGGDATATVTVKFTMSGTVEDYAEGSANRL